MKYVWASTPTTDLRLLGVTFVETDIGQMALSFSIAALEFENYANIMVTGCTCSLLFINRRDSGTCTSST